MHHGFSFFCVMVIRFFPGYAAAWCGEKSHGLCPVIGHERSGFDGRGLLHLGWRCEHPDGDASTPVRGCGHSG